MNGMFEIFGDFTNETAGTVRDNLMGWIYMTTTEM